MALYTARSILRVFIASPGDLEPERRIARSVVDELNHIVREIGWHIELLGWEDTLPGYTRPQDAINRDVDSCNLFVGLLWGRWGTRTGEFSSGFEEEFERARGRRQSEKAPEIWLFFKKVDAAQLEDPGDQLKKVLAFRRQRKARKDVFFKDFEHPADWEGRFREYLLRYLLRVRESLQPPPLASASVPPAALAETTAPTTVQESSDITVAARGQISEILGRLGREIAGNRLDQPDEERILGVFDLSRLQLLTSGLVSIFYPGELLGNHEINRLYRFKEELRFGAIEADLILRTLVADAYEAVLGWYWFRDMSIDTLADILVTLAMRDPLMDVRRGALETLRRGGIRPTSGGYADPAVLAVALLDTPEELRKITIQYLGTIAGRERWDLGQEFINNAGLEGREDFIQAWLLNTGQEDPEAALRYIVERGISPEPEVFKHLEAQSTRLLTDSLVRALEHGEARVRAMAAETLLRRHNLTTEQASRLAEDPSVDVRKVAFRVLVEQGIESDPVRVRKSLGPLPPNFIMRAIYRNLAVDALVREADWYSVDGPIAYGVMTQQYFQQFGNRIRRDLADRFSSHEQESKQRVAATLGPLLAEALSQQMTPIAGFLRGKFIAEALNSLADHAEQTDVEIARRYLADPGPDIDVGKEEVRVGAIRVLERAGDASDIPSLIAIGKEAYGELKQVAGEAALRLSPGPTGATLQLLETGDEGLIQLAFGHLTEAAQQIRNVANQLLRHENPSIRKAALGYLATHLDENELAELLTSYQQGRYFYNVVCWTDRILFAPPRLREPFRKELLKPA